MTNESEFTDLKSASLLRCISSFGISSKSKGSRVSASDSSSAFDADSIFWGTSAISTLLGAAISNPKELQSTIFCSSIFLRTEWLIFKLLGQSFFNVKCFPRISWVSSNSEEVNSQAEQRISWPSRCIPTEENLIAVSESNFPFDIPMGADFSITVAAKLAAW